MIDSKSIAHFGRVGSSPTIPKNKYIFENYKCFFMNGFSKAIEFQKEKNKFSWFCKTKWSNNEGNNEFKRDY